MKLLSLRLSPTLLMPLVRATAVLFLLLFLFGAARAEAADTPASWTSAVTGNWTTAADWSTTPNAPNNGVGGVNYAVTIGATGSPYTITVNTAITVDTLALSSANATLSLTTSGVLTVLGTDSLTAGTLQLSGGTLSGGGTGTLNFAGGSLVIGSNSQNIISGLTINGDLTLNTSSAETQIANGTTFNTAHLATQGTGLGFATGQTFNNTISFEGVVGGSRNVEMNGGNGTLTIGSAGVIKTVAGFAGGGFIGGANDYGGQMALTNQGLILSQVSGTAITIQANTFTNATAGVVQATNGGIVSINSPTWNNAGNINSLTGSTLNFAGNWSNTGTVTVDATSKLFLGGTFATSGLGTLALSAGSAVSVNGAWTNTGQTFTLNSSTGSWTLAGGSLTGGTLNVISGTSLLFGSNAQNLLSGVTINGDITLSSNTAETQIAGNTTFNTAHLATQGAGLGFAPGQTFNNTVSLEGAAGGSRNVELNGTAGTFTIGGSGLIKSVAGFAGFGSIGAANNFGGQMALTNQGTILSQVSAQAINIQANTFTNAAAGLVQATGGGIVSINSPTWNNAGNLQSLTGSTLNLAGNWSNTGTITVDATSRLFLGGTFATSPTTGLGTLALSAGSAVSVNGAWTNTGQTFTLNSSTGSWTIAGGSLTGGTLNVLSGTNLLFTSAGQNLLSGVTINGDLLLSNNAAVTQIAGNTTFTTAHLASQASGLGFAPGQTFNNTISFEGATGGSRNVELNGTSGTFTIGSGGVIQTTAGFGAFGQIGSGNSYGGQMALTNQGKILSQVSGQSILIVSNTFTNGATGLLQATGGGILTITPLAANPWTNTGTIAVSTGGIVNLGGTFDATGAGGIGTFNNTGGTVNVTGTLTNTGKTLTLNSSTGSWTVNGGTINGGTIASANGAGLLFTNVAANLLNGVTVNGDLTLSASNAETQIAGGTTFVTARLANTSAALGFATGQTVTGTISFEGASTSNRFVDMNGTAGSLTIGSTGILTTAAGFAGNAVIGGTGAYNGAMALTNQGLISSQVSGRTITILANTFANSAGGTLQASNGGILTITPPIANAWTNTGTIAVSTGGIVNLGGTFDATGAGGIGTFNNTGGTVNVTGTLNNTGKTLTLNSSTGSWTVSGGTINGGTLAFANGATLMFANVAANLLTGVTVNGDLTLSASNAETQIAGGTTFVTAHLDNTSAALGFATGQTLTGTISFEGASTSNRFVDMNGTAGSLTIGSTGVITTAAGLAGNAVIGGTGAYNGAMALTNKGLISSQVSGQTITIQANTFANSTGGILQASNGGILTITPPAANPWTNTGTIAVSTGGIVNLGGTLDATGVGGIGTFNNTGGTINVNGTINNTGRTLTLNSSTGSWIMNGGTLSGGSLAFANGATLMFANVSSNLLTGVTVNGDLTLSASGARTQIAGGTTFVTAHLANTSATLGFAPGQTLTGTVSFEGASTSGRYVDMNGTAGTLTIGSTGVMTTAAGLAGSVVIGGATFYNGAMSLVNNGMISSQTSGQTVTIQANTFANSTGGTLQASNGGILTIAPPAANPWTNTGTIAVSTGSIVNLGGTFDATGAGGIGTFNNTGGTISVNGTINNSGRTLTLNSSTGSWLMSGGTLSGGSLAYANGATLMFGNVSSNLLTGVTVNGDLTLSASGARTQIAGGTTFATAHLANTSATLGFAPGQTLTGTVSFEGASNSGRYVDMNGTAGTLTIGSTGVMTTAAGFAGSVVIGGTTFYNGAMSLVNNGLISSQTSGLTITIQANTFANSTGGTLQASNGGILTITPPAGNPWTNTGTIAVSTGGIVNFGGTLDATGAGGIGAFNNTGGTINVNGTINNTGRTLTLNSSTGSWTMNGGTLNGGTLAYANGATLLFANVSSNLLTGVTVNGDLTLSASGARTQIAGGTTFATAHLANTSATLGFAPGQTLTGTVSFEGAASGRYVEMNGSAGTLTIGSTGVMTTAAGFTGSAVIGGANFYSGAMTLINNGLISSQTNGATVTISAPIFTNNGTLQASNGGILTIAPTAATPWTNTGTIAVSTGGIVNFGGTFDATGAGGIGSFNNTGGTINVNGTINNTGRTLTLSSSTGSWTMNGGTLSGGSLAYANGATLMFANVASNLLTGVTVNGDLTLSAPGARTQIAGGTTFATAHLANTSATLGFAPGQTLTGTVSFEGASSGRYVEMNGSAGTLTIGSTGVMTTAAGFAGTALIGGANFYGGAMTLINNGLISSQTNGTTVTIVAPVFTDNGTLQASNGGILAVTAGYTQTGATSVTRLNNGTITVGSGKTITIAAGRLEGAGMITGNVTNMGTLSPTLAAAPAAGILKISGDLTLAASSNVQIALGGLTQGTGYDEITEAGATQLVLGGVLSISLINGFTATSAAETFTILASNVAIAGMFSNVVSGRVTSVDGSEQFLVNVVGNNVVLTPAITPVTEVRVTTGSKPAAVALDPVTNQVYVANLGDGVNPSTVTVIDGATNNPGTVNAGVAPTAIALNPVTNQVYVVNRGDGTHASIVTVIDGASRATTPVTVGVGAQAVALNPVTNKTYVTNRVANTVTVIDGASRATTTVSAGTNPSALAVNPTTNLIYVANTGSGTVTVLNGATGGTAATVNVGSNPVAVAVNALTNKIYVANAGDGTNPSTVTVIDGATNVPTSVAAGVSPTALAVNPATNKIYVVNFVSDTITVIDGGTLTTATVAVQFSPNAIAVDAATNLIYLTNSVSGTLTSIDGQTNATTNFLVGTSPSALAINPLTNRIYVLDQASNDVVVKDGSINNTATVTVGTNPLAMAVNPITNATYVVNGGSNPQLPGTVTVINGFGNTTASVAVGKQPVAIALNPVTNLAYVANQADGTVSVIDGSSNGVTTLTIGGTPSAVAVNPVNNEIYVIDSLNSVVAVIDGVSHSISSVAVVSGPKAIAVNPATNQVLVAGGSGASGSLTIIDGTTLTTTSVAVGAGPKSVAVNPVTNQIYVVNSQAATVTVIDGTTYATATVSAGAGAAFVAVNSVTNLIYVANATANTVTVINGATNATASVTVGSAPAFLAVNPVNNQIYVTNGGDGTVTVIDGASNLTAPITVGTTPGPAAVNPATNKLYVANQGSGSVTVVTPAVSAQSNLTTFIASLPGNEVFSNSATLNLSAGSLSDPPPPGQQIYYQLDTASGPWLPAVASGPNNTAALTGLLPGLHTLYTFAADALQTASIDASASAGPIASQIAAYTFLASPGGTFTFQNSSVLIHNTDSMVTVTVVRDFDAPASVRYRAVSGTAVEGTNFEPTQGTLFFTQGQTSQTITVPIISQDLGEAQAFFSVELSSPSTSSFIGTPGSIGVFMLNDSTADLALSSLAFVAPAAAPGAGGSITVSLTPPAANGQWRLLGELAWRNSGDTVSGLISADYVVEFKQVSGYQAPDLLVVTVLAGMNAPASGPYMASAAQPAGSLSVNLAPPGTGGWRLQGESAFRAGGSTATALNAGSYIVEFQPVAGLSTPANSEVNVQAGQLNTFSTTYLMGDSPSGVVPALADGFASGDKRILPATSYTGQIQTDNGFGTGFVPMDRVVVTAAHVLFDDGSLTYVSGIRWFFQHDTGSFEAPPQIPRGFYVLDGYASQRAVDNNPGISSTTSQGLDAAAMYFLEPAARGGASGYLASSSAANAWLTNSSGAIMRDKFIAGYPVGTVDPATIGRLYATPLVTDPFQFVTGSLFKTQALTSYPGNSGGPLFVGYNDPLHGETFYPAAIYLGGTMQTVVRAIDGQVIDLMSRAEVSGNGGANNVGGGVVQVNAGLSGSTAFALATVNVALLPAGVARAGARWGLNSAPNRQSGEAILNLPPGTYTIHFSPVTGYSTPAPIQMTVKAGQAVNATGSYALKQPVITSRNVATAIAGQPFRFQVTASPSPTSFSSSALPDGLTLDPMSGLISGITFQASPVTVSLQATNAAGQGTASDLQLTVAMAGQLNVAVTGTGAVTKALANSTVQAVGSNLTILATPAPGFLFENWSSTDPDTGVTQVIWHHPSYAFEMPTILSLQANFIKNPFPLLIGAYNGLLRPPAGVSDPDTLGARGSVTLSVTSLGGFTGSLYIGKQKYTLRGTFDATGAYAGIVAGARGQPSLVLNLQLDTTGATQQVTGSASLSGAPLALAAYRASFTAASPAPQALGLRAGAHYTMALPHATTAGAPGGDGFGTVTVSPTGAVRFIGTLGDGTAITQGTSLGHDGQWPFFMLLYGQGGALTGLLHIPAPPSSTVIGGSLDWFAPKITKALFYPNGFTTAVSVQGAVVNATPLTGLTQGTLTLTGGALNPAVAPIGLTFDTKGNVTGTGLTAFKIIPATGLFSGQFQSGTQKVLFRGALLPAAGAINAAGFGFFKGNTQQTGAVEF